MFNFIDKIVTGVSNGVATVATDVANGVTQVANDVVNPVPALTKNIRHGKEIEDVSRIMSNMIEPTRNYVKSLHASERATHKKDAIKLGSLLERIDVLNLGKKHAAEIEDHIADFENVIGHAFHLEPEVFKLMGAVSGLVAKNPGLLVVSKKDQHSILKNALGTPKNKNMLLGASGVPVAQNNHLTSDQQAAVVVFVLEVVGVILALIIAVSASVGISGTVTIGTGGAAAPITIPTAVLAVSAEVIVAILAITALLIDLGRDLNW